MTNLVHLDIASFKKKYNLENFIETGCWHGDGIQQALNAGFNKIYSCDTNIDFVNECNNRFNDRNKIWIMNSDSVSFILTTLTFSTSIRSAPTLFWLDAHFPVDYGSDSLYHTEKYRLPLVDEIKEIKYSGKDITKDVIICDDIRNLRSTMNSRYHQNELDERFIIDIDWEEFTTLLSDTHTFEMKEHYDGIGYFLPKQ